MKDLGFVYRLDCSEVSSAKTLLLLHGTGGTEDDLIGLGRSVAPGFNLLSVRGKVLEKGMNRFFRRKAVGVFDIEDLKFRAKELAEFIRNARKEFCLNEVIAVGYSNGANITTAIVFDDPELLAGAILIRPMVPYQPENLDLKRIKILMLSGLTDNTMTKEEPEKLKEILACNNANITAHLLPTSHSLVPDDLRISKEWLRSNF